MDQADLRHTVLEPWVAGLPLELGDQTWAPHDCRLTILEGPELPAPAADDEGWAAALRGAEDVTRPLLEAAEASAPAQTAMVIEANSVDGALQELTTGRAPRQIPWVDAVRRIEGRDAEVAAVILVVKRPWIPRRGS